MAKNSKQVTEQANEVKEIKEVKEVKEIKENVTETQEIAKVQENQADESQAPMEEVKADAPAAKADTADAVISAPGEDLYKKHAAAVKDAKQFYQCKLPSMSYYSKRALCEAVDNMKRMNDRTKGIESLDMCIEMLEMAVAYLYSRKVNG